MRQEAARYVPGMRVELRDAEWRIDRIDVPSHGGERLTCTGQSQLVRGRTGTFLTGLERDVRILQPESTELVDDLSRGYAATQLRIHALLESTPPADEKIHLGHRAAMDLLPFQLDPALQALAQTRPRLLIADAVGLGKTLGAGILVTELIRRGRGKRILVLGVKSMLAQLQREFWQRFTIRRRGSTRSVCSACGTRSTTAEWAGRTRCAILDAGDDSKRPAAPDVAAVDASEALCLSDCIVEKHGIGRHPADRRDTGLQSRSDPVDQLRECSLGGRASCAEAGKRNDTDPLGVADAISPSSVS